MKLVSIFATLVLMAGMAVGQQNPYQLRNLRGAQSDITSQTGTVSAWKYVAGNPVCAPKTLEFGALDNSISCMGANSGPPYKFNKLTKAWNAQSSMGTAPAQLLVVNWGSSNLAANVYSLQPTATCGWNYGGSGKQSYDLFHWNPSTNAWTQPHPGSCMFQGSVDYKGILYVVGWDGSNHETALFQSTDAGQTWQLWSDSWQFVQMTNRDYGCAVSNAGSLWQVNTSGPAVEFPALPSGTAVGCVMTRDPFSVLAWNSSGQAYVTLDTATWQAVTGINLQAAVGQLGYYIFGEDSSGKPYHWNVNAPGVTATYGGQWATQDGCPTPSNPCHTNITHTVKFQARFSSGHGVGGQQGSSTQLFTNNIEVDGWDYSPGCDPIFGPPADPECRISLAAEARCNQSNQDVGNFNITDVVDDSIDVMDFQYNIGQNGAVLHDILPDGSAGYWDGTVINSVIPGCSVNDPIPVCPAESPAYINYKAWWYGNTAGQEGQAFDKELQYLDNSKLGDDDPYVYTSFYLATVDANGNIVGNPICFGPGNEPDAWGVTQPGEPPPACK